MQKCLVNPFLIVAGYTWHETFSLWRHFFQCPLEIGSACAEKWTIASSLVSGCGLSHKCVEDGCKSTCVTFRG